MLELKLKCKSVDEARIYLNGLQYYNLLGDMREALRAAYKHGTEAEVLKVINGFYPDIDRAVDNNSGAY